MLRESERTLRASRTLGKLVRLILAHVVTFALSSMARLTEMGCTPAVPLGGRAAEATLEFDKVSSMRFALLDSVSGSNTRACTAN